MLGRSIRGGTIELQSVIGDGGMGRVYKGVDRNLSRIVAVKVLRPEHQSMETAKVYFEREARSASKLWHPNIIQIIDFGAEEDGTLYLVMEYVPGRNLADILDKDFPLPAERTVRILSQLLTALEEAHNQGVIHRDLKPENIMLQDIPGNPDFVKVLDFGVAKAMEQDAAGPMTMAGLVMGTPHFMSPEQALGHEIDHRSDLYSVGALMYQMLTRQLPFEGRLVMNVLAKVISERPEPPSKRCPDIYILPALEEVCLRAMRKNAAGRYQNAAEFRGALLALDTTGVPTPEPQETAIPQTETISATDLEPFRRRKRTAFTDSVYDLAVIQKDLDVTGEQRRVGVLTVQARLEALSTTEQGEVTQDFRRLFESEVQRFAGVPTSHIGAVSAGVFGYPRTLEDEVRFAVQAASSIRQLVAERYPRVSLGIGIAHGSIVVPDSEIGAAYGGPLDQALRLAGVAGPDEVLADKSVARLNTSVHLEATQDEGVFRVRDEAPERRQQPVQVALPLLGRQRQLGQSQELLALISAGEATSAAIVGPEGSGKSRMLAVLARDAERQRIAVVNAPSERFPSAQVGLTLARLVKGGLELVPATSRQEAMIELGLSTDQMKVLKFLLKGVPAPHHARFWIESSAAAVVAMVRALSRRAPLLIICDSFESADMLTFKVMDRLTMRLEGERVGVVIAGVATHPLISAFCANHITISLPELEEKEVDRFLGDNFPDLEPDVRSAVTKRSKGLPSNIDLFVRYLRSYLPRRPEDLPESPMDVLGSCLDELPESARKLAAIAGALGASFPLDALSGSCPKSWDLRTNLQIIGEQGLLSIHEDEDRVWLRFEPARLSRLALAQVMDETRVEIHCRIARYYERTRGNTKNPDHDFQWARQLKEAGFDKDAVKMFAIAADNAMALYGPVPTLPVLDSLLHSAHEVFEHTTGPFQSVILKAALFMIRAGHSNDALQLLGRLEHIEMTSAAMAEFYLLKGESLFGLGRMEEALEAIKVAADTVPNRSILYAHIHMQAGRIYERLEDVEQCIQESQKTIDVVANRKDRLLAQHKQLAWRPLLVQGKVFMQAKNFEQAYQRLFDGLEAAELQDDPIGKVEANHHLAILLRSQGQFEESCTAYQAAIDATIVCGDIRSRLQTVLGLATLLFELGATNACEVLLEQGIELSRNAGRLDMLKSYDKWLEKVMAAD
ncbi:MAG: hypothetical protein AUK47_26545 [Deltaproteobacteria bacterium CG2_30_63_29]|nr:MAG: hypothetical protein AUK47_26545 [Deltaproteobacteria bacterium CG2_30_63_29]